MQRAIQFICSGKKVKKNKDPIAIKLLSFRTSLIIPTVKIQQVLTMGHWLFQMLYMDLNLKVLGSGRYYLSHLTNNVIKDQRGEQTTRPRFELRQFDSRVFILNLCNTFYTTLRPKYLPASSTITSKPGFVICTMGTALPTLKVLLWRLRECMKRA